MKPRVYLGDKERKECLEKYINGTSIRQLSREYNVDPRVVKKILRKNKIEIRTGLGGYRKYSLNQDTFSDAENNPEAAYWVGFLMADGYVNEKFMYTALFLSETDVDHVEKFRDFLGTNKPVSIRERIVREGSYKNSKNSASLSVNSSKIVMDLVRYGVIQNKTGREEAKLLENNPHFWRGMIDGDGYISFQKNSSIGSPYLSLTGSKIICEQFSKFIESLVGEIPRISKCKPRLLYRIIITCSKAITVMKTLYQNSTVFLNRKMEKAKELMEWKSNKKVIPDLTLEEFDKLREDYGSWKAAAKILGISYDCLRKKRNKKKGVY